MAIPFPLRRSILDWWCDLRFLVVFRVRPDARGLKREDQQVHTVQHCDHDRNTTQQAKNVSLAASANCSARAAIRYRTIAGLLSLSWIRVCLFKDRGRSASASDQVDHSLRLGDSIEFGRSIITYVQTRISEATLVTRCLCCLCGGGLFLRFLWSNFAVLEDIIGQVEAARRQ